MLRSGLGRIGILGAGLTGIALMAAGCGGGGAFVVGR